MHILFLTHYFPPEVNAPASRTYENAKRWVEAGHQVTVITCVPNHPRGIPYPGYRNKLWQWDEISGIRVLRVVTYLSPNQGFLRRAANYVSYMLSATLLSSLVGRPDIIVSTSPQFFCGMAGYFVSRLKRRPWVLEIRDLWPESIKAVGAINDGRVIHALECLETFLYRKADHIISVTNSFKTHIEKRGVPAKNISVLTNGADLDRYRPLIKENGVRQELGLEGKFVASYLGTHGMAHGLDTVLKAADLLRDKDQVRFLLVGDGAERENLLHQKERMGLENVLMLPQQPKEKMPGLLAASDACMILLRKQDLFKTVIPSKMFEAMAMERPVILGVEGESRGIVEKTHCGICIEPENHRELARAVLQLLKDAKLLDTLGRQGREAVTFQYNRQKLAEKYLDILIQTTKR